MPVAFLVFIGIGIIAISAIFVRMLERYGAIQSKRATTSQKTSVAAHPGKPITDPFPARRDWSPDAPASSIAESAPPADRRASADRSEPIGEIVAPPPAPSESAEVKHNCIAETDGSTFIADLGLTRFRREIAGLASNPMPTLPEPDGYRDGRVMVTVLPEPQEDSTKAPAKPVEVGADQHATPEPAPPKDEPAVASVPAEDGPAVVPSADQLTSAMEFSKTHGRQLTTEDDLPASEASDQPSQPNGEMAPNGETEVSEVATAANAEESANHTGLPTDSSTREFDASTADDGTLTERESHAAPDWGDNLDSVPASAPADIETQEELASDGTSVQRREAVFQDRRGAARRIQAPIGPASAGLTRATEVRQAQAELRLTIDEIDKHVILSLVLLRPDGFPNEIEIGAERVEAFDESRYDDVDFVWSEDALRHELRISDASGRYQWVRSRRPIHIFAGSAGEPDLLATNAARLAVEHAIICTDEDAEEVVKLARDAGSPALVDCSAWRGVPAGWNVFARYKPQRALVEPAPRGFSSLDPGRLIEVELVGGLEVRHHAYAEAHPPAIWVESLPPNCEVLIDGQVAVQDANGAWKAAGSDAPGRHLVQVVPGPSMSFELIPDPAPAGWTPPEEMTVPTIFAGVSICGAMLRAPAGLFLAAAPPGAAATALGPSGQVQGIPLRRDLAAAIAALPFEPSFLVSSWGVRRTQGEIVWTGTPAIKGPHSRRHRNRTWTAAVRHAAARHLPVGPGARARAEWQKMAASARRSRPEP